MTFEVVRVLPCETLNEVDLGFSRDEDDRPDFPRVMLVLDGQKPIEWLSSTVRFYHLGPNRDQSGIWEGDIEPVTTQQSRLPSRLTLGPDGTGTLSVMTR